jgi:hypothetical protein
MNNTPRWRRTTNDHHQEQRRRYYSKGVGHNTTEKGENIDVPYKEMFNLAMIIVHFKGFLTSSNKTRFFGKCRYFCEGCFAAFYNLH